jgi:hypothetical protein
MGSAVYDAGMEGAGFGDIFGDPDELQRRLAEFAEQMQGNQRLAWADNAIKLAVDMTVAAVARQPARETPRPGRPGAHLHRTRLPKAVTLVREARAGLQ